MVHALWVHDHVFLRGARGEVYTSSGKLPYDTWGRYLTSFDELAVASRIRDHDATMLPEAVQLSSGDQVQFAALPNINSLPAAVTRRREVLGILRKLIANTDALIARLPSENSVLAIRAAKELGRPYAVEVVGCARDALYYHGSLAGKLYAPYAFSRMKQLVLDAPYALYVSEQFLPSRYPCNGVTCVCSDVSISSLDDELLRKRYQKLKDAEGDFKIGIIGSLDVAYKGLGTAIRSLALVKSEIANARLYVLGGGDADPWIETARRYGVDQCITFCGTLPHGRAVFEWLDNIDLYIQPSFVEGLPRALVEACSRACPCLGSTAGGIPEILESQCLHPPGDYRKLAELIMMAWNDKGWMKEQANRNFHVAGNYSESRLSNIRQEFWGSFAQWARIQGGQCQ